MSCHLFHSKKAEKCSLEFIVHPFAALRSGDAKSATRSRIVILNVLSFLACLGRALQSRPVLHLALPLAPSEELQGQLQLQLQAL